jgi:hypothetical protein
MIYMPAVRRQSFDAQLAANIGTTCGATFSVPADIVLPLPEPIRLRA